HQSADELDDAGETELRHDRHLLATKHAQELLRAVHGEEQPADHAKEGVDLWRKAPEDSFHDNSCPPDLTLARFLPHHFSLSRLSRSCAIPCPTLSRGGSQSKDAALR